MQMNFGLSMSHKLDQRTEMLQRVEAAMHIEQRLVLELRQYLQREDAFKALYEKALKRGDVRMYQKHGLAFEYARLKRAELPRDMAESRSAGFAHCLYNTWEALLFSGKTALVRGSWLLFVVPDMLSPIVYPEPYVEYVAVHEHGEEMTLGEHSLASKLEFATAQREKRLPLYMRWLEDHYHEKFADIFSNQTRIILPDSEEFQQMLQLKSKEKYATKVRGMIEGFQWPGRIIQKLSLYERRAREVEEMVIKMCGVVGSVAKALPISTKISDGVDHIRRALRGFLVKIKEKQGFICWSNVKELYPQHRTQIATEFAMYREACHQAILREHGPEAGELAYLDELAGISRTGNLPTEGILSTDLKEALAAL